jgi:anaerobic magnesium-protoporphyrin IX monomethyl ester cyclase
MHIFLLNPSFLGQYGRFSREQRSPAITKSGTFYYPMWLSYATGVLEKHGFKATLFDCPADNLQIKDIETFVKREKPPLVVIATSTPSIHSDIQTGEIIKQLNPDAFVVLVGPHVSAIPEATLHSSQSVDAVAIHEYEYTLLDLANSLKNNTEWRSLPGLCYRSNGQIIKNPKREFIKELDSLPFVSSVYKKHLNYKNYFYSHSRYPIVTTISGRGCPHQCIYCVYPQTFSGRRARYRSVENVVDEIAFILKEFPDVKEVMFEDDTLTLHKKRCFEFAEEVLRRNIKFTWSANSRADVDLETLKILRRAGARLFCVGVESGDQLLLDKMKKNLSLEQVRQFFQDAKKAGILIHGCFLVGVPGETKDTMHKTLALAKELNPDTAQFFPIMVYPGTEAYHWAHEHNYLLTDDFRQWLTEDGLHDCVISRPELSNKDLVEFCDHCRRKFYLRPSYISKKMLMSFTSYYEFKRLFKGARSLSKFLFRGSGEKEG